MRMTQPTPSDDDAPGAEVIDLDSLRGKPRYGWIERILKDAKGRIKPVIANATTIVGNTPEWAEMFVYDEFRGEVRTVRLAPWDTDEMPSRHEVGPWTEADTTRLVCWLTRHYGVTFTGQQIYEAVDVVARRRTVHPIRDWLGVLKWDGVPRLDTWVSTYLGVRQTPYARAVARCFLISACARVLLPGCKVDTVLILDGKQGAFKSTAVHILFGREFVSDTPLEFDSKDRFGSLKGHWCVELAELDGMDRAEANRVKAFLSSSYDDYRPPYGRYVVRVPRQCVFVGTVNPQDYLRDPTGGRRFWPVDVGTIDLVGLERDREQLWAEARVAYEDGKPWWPSAELAEDFKDEVSKRTVHDEWQVKIARWAVGRTELNIGDILTHVFNVEQARWAPSDQTRVARCLQQLGYTRHQVRRDGVRVRVYTLGDQPPVEDLGQRALPQTDHSQDASNDDAAF